jgi:lambda repressor-like predicted transcriptional regulator
MPKDSRKSKGEPLTPKDIKRVFIERGDTIAAKAREWGVSSWQLRAVIYRYPEVVYQEIREQLADYMDCDVSRVGREPLREPVEAAA